MLEWIKKTVLGTPHWRLSNAIKGGDLEKVRQALKDGASIQGGPGEPPLCQAMMAGKKAIAMMEELLKLGADPNEKSHDSGESSPLHLISFCENASAIAVPLVTILLKAGASATLKNGRGETPLTLMASRPCRFENWALDVCRLLLLHGAKPDETGGSGLSARMMFMNAEQESLKSSSMSLQEKDRARVARERFEALCESIEIDLEMGSPPQIRSRMSHRL